MARTPNIKVLQAWLSVSCAAWWSTDHQNDVIIDSAREHE